MSEKQETPPRLWVQLFNNFVSTYEDPREVHDNGKPVHVYVPESELARVRRETWEAAIKKVTEAHWDGVGNSYLAFLIDTLEAARDESERQG